MNVAKIIISVCERVDNVTGKGENAGYQHFPKCFQKLFSSALLKFRFCVKEGCATKQPST